MTQAILVIATSDARILAELETLRNMDITIEVIEDMTDWMLQQPDTFTETELDLMVSGLLNADDFGKILQRILDEAIEAASSSAPMNESHAHSIPMPDFRIYEDFAPDFSDIPLKETINIHPTRVGREQTRTSMRAQPPRSHREQFPFVPSRHGNR